MGIMLAAMENSEDASDLNVKRSGTRKRQPTIYDVAERVGLNASTVSRALNKPGRTNPTTEAKVRAAAAELGFRTNPFARALPTGKTGTFAIVLADITNPVHFELIRGAEQVTRAKGHTLVFSESQGSAERELDTISTLQRSVDGLLVVASRLSDEQLRQLSEVTPIVAANHQTDSLPSVVPDIRLGYTAALDHLQALGHRSVAYLSGPLASLNNSRWELLYSLAVERDMSVVEISAGGATVEAGATIFPRVLASGATSVLAYNDLVAHGILRAARAGGIDVPGKFSLVGFDNIFSAELSVPALTTVRAPLYEIGTAAMELLIDDEQNQEPLRMMLPTEFINRESTGPAPT